MIEPCPRWNGHKFEPRYDTKEAFPKGFFGSVKSIRGDPQRFIEKQKTYVRDVCVYCGLTRERK